MGLEFVFQFCGLGKDLVLAVNDNAALHLDRVQQFEFPAIWMGPQPEHDFITELLQQPDLAEVLRTALRVIGSRSYRIALSHGQASLWPICSS